MDKRLVARPTMTPDQGSAVLLREPMPTRQHLYAGLFSEGLTVREIADKAGVHYQSVRQGLIFHDHATCFHCKKAGAR